MNAILKLFEYEEMDLCSESSWQFYDCTLKVPIGSFKSGTKLHVILVDVGEGIIQLWETEADLEHPPRTFTLNLSVGEEKSTSTLDSNT